MCMLSQLMENEIGLKTTFGKAIKKLRIESIVDGNDVPVDVFAFLQRYYCLNEVINLLIDCN